MTAAKTKNGPDPFFAGMKVRAATEADLAAIFAIYDDEVLHGTATFDTQPRTPAERIEWFRSDGGGRYPLLVGEVDGEVVGWARLYAWSPRPAYNRTAENAVYVARGHRGKGISRALMKELMRLAPARGVQVLVARVVEGNPASLALHEKLGFRTIGVMRRVGEKFGRLLDVRLMDRHLDA
jgi:phosphinothricin acetyltransferase